mmetsp:Transcript_1629/g.3989  ORF Transcript_1629/g.3989 Transcript_1629/m.3989 type:complete len:149 (-) Transcript_1629:154-600(-)
MCCKDDISVPRIRWGTDDEQEPLPEEEEPALQEDFVESNHGDVLMADPGSGALMVLHNEIAEPGGLVTGRRPAADLDVQNDLVELEDTAGGTDDAALVARYQPAVRQQPAANTDVQNDLVLPEAFETDGSASGDSADFPGLFSQNDDD